MVVSNRNLLFQGSIFRGELLVSGRVALFWIDLLGCPLDNLKSNEPMLVSKHCGRKLHANTGQKQIRVIKGYTFLAGVSDK